VGERAIGLSSPTVQAKPGRQTGFDVKDTKFLAINVIDPSYTTVKQSKRLQSITDFYRASA